MYAEQTLTEQFEEWLELNPDFYPLFEKFTNELIDSGVKKSSAWLVCNRIRWESMIQTIGNDYKISNDFIALLSRKFLAENPQHPKFFTIKEMKRA
ncbi:MAG: hypothetical protein [Caudoviricetes sp.]|nr:MAG: hypothetical protein [Caudoviricetes sp.]